MTSLVVGTATLGLIYFFVCVALAGGLLVSPLIGALAYFYWRLLDPDAVGQRGHLRVLATAGVGTGLAFVAEWLGNWNKGPLLADGAGVLVAAAVASAIYSLRAQSGTVPCMLCDQSAAGRQGFDCPRCGDRVCARTTCWNARYFRCTRCHEREIVIFPISEKWWVARLGRRVMKGECLSCYKEAQETDLRECGQCHWPMCRRCWDHHNGACQRCEWIMPDLPPKLVTFIRKSKPRSDRASQGKPPRKPGGGDRGPAGGGAPPPRPPRQKPTDPSDETVKRPYR